jgi:glycosyltransferase involved in cell wall biosynthesis
VWGGWPAGPVFDGPSESGGVGGTKGVEGMDHKTRRILVVGQTPPPWGGQAVMIRQLLEHPPAGVALTHVRLAFSGNMDAIGKLRWRKFLHLGQVVFQILLARLRQRARVLYYPPAGAHRVPVYRDFVILGLTRWAFRQTVFHFHASGLSQIYARLNAPERWLFRQAYFHPDVAIQTSDANPPDGAFLKAGVVVTVPCGLPDEFSRFQAQARSERAGVHVPRILFVGALYESKGVRVLMDAVRLLRAAGQEFTLDCVGCFESPVFEAEVRETLRAESLAACMAFPGVLTGDDKWRAYARADVFCLPSYFEAESFGLVNLEAMMFALPVVSTRWRGIPSVVRDGESGWLVPIQDAPALAEKLGRLLRDPELRGRMGEEGRRVYLDQFSLEAWRAGMTRALSLVFREERSET